MVLDRNPVNFFAPTSRYGQTNTGHHPAALAGGRCQTRSPGPHGRRSAVGFRAARLRRCRFQLPVSVAVIVVLDEE